MSGLRGFATQRARRVSDLRHGQTRGSTGRPKRYNPANLTLLVSDKPESAPEFHAAHLVRVVDIFLEFLDGHAD